MSDYNGYGARNPFRYRGYYFDNDLGMYYLTTRYYDPQTGRFINADTIEYLKPDEWWKFWDYQIGTKTTIGDYSQSYSFGIGESNYSISLGNSSIDFTIGLMETGIGTSHSVDDITYYNQLYIRPIVILIAVVFVNYVIPAVSSSGVFIPVPV